MHWKKQKKRSNINRLGPDTETLGHEDDNFELGVHMNKKDLIASLAEQEGISNSESARVVDLFFNAMADGLVEGHRVEVRGLCTFQVKTYKGYTGRNPMTGKAVAVRPKKLPVFKPGTDLKERVDR
jgi:integration host factor subunit beta